MSRKKFKKDLGLTNKIIADIFGISEGAFKNSSAKDRYENALVKFYEYIKSNNF